MIGHQNWLLFTHGINMHLECISSDHLWLDFIKGRVSDFMINHLICQCVNCIFMSSIVKMHLYVTCSILLSHSDPETYLCSMRWSKKESLCFPIIVLFLCTPRPLRDNCLNAGLDFFFFLVHKNYIFLGQSDLNLRFFLFVIYLFIIIFLCSPRWHLFD